MSKAFIILIFVIVLGCVSEPSKQEDSNTQNNETVETHPQEDTPPPEPEEIVEQTNPIYSGLTEAEIEFVSRYLNKMIYMVYFDEETEEDEYYISGALNKANEYLIENSLVAIDLDQIEKIKEDQILAYEEQTGQSESIIQWIANKLNADIYIEVSAKTEGSTQIGGKYYGTAQLELKAYETSTAILMGSASYTTIDQKFSTVSEENARFNAIQEAVNIVMPRVIEQIRENMKNSAINGIRYEVIIQNPLGDRAMNSFWDKLSGEVKDIQAISQSMEEIRYNIWYIGSMVELKSLIYNITETISGLQNMEMVYSRGKSITFHTGY